MMMRSRQEIKMEEAPHTRIRGADRRQNMKDEDAMVNALSAERKGTVLEIVAPRRVRRKQMRQCRAS